MVGKFWEDKMEYENFTSPKKQTCSCNNLFLTQSYNGKGEKDLHFRYTTHITRTSRVWQAIWGADIFSTSYSQKWPQDHYFSQKVLLVGTPTVITQEQRHRGGQELFPAYTLLSQFFFTSLRIISPCTQYRHNDFIQKWGIGDITF